MRGSLIGLFAELGGDAGQNGDALPDYMPNTDTMPHDGLFADAASKNQIDVDSGFLADAAVVAGLYSDSGIDFSTLPEAAGRLFELSVDGFSAVVHGWMSELPIQAEMRYFGRKILAAGGTTADREAANRAASDRGDPQIRQMLEIHHKVWHEVHRFQGLLRFSPNEDGIFIARFAPDYLILPALGNYFSQRFGDNCVGWAIIDEKRGLCLSRRANEPPQLGKTGGVFAAPAENTDKWEDLWRHYHQTINNEGRSNPNLQKQFMPKRHWKYLPEMQN